MQAITYFFEQLIRLWREKMMLAAVLTVSAQVLEQFASTFDADTVLILLLLVLVVVEIVLSLAAAIKSRDITFGFVARATMKLPLICLYLFLVGAMGLSVDKAININLPILNIFIAYLISTEVFVILKYLDVLGVKVPPLLLFMLNAFREKVEKALRGAFPDKKDEAEHTSQELPMRQPVEHHELK